MKTDILEAAKDKDNLGEQLMDALDAASKPWPGD